MDDLLSRGFDAFMMMTVVITAFAIGLDVLPRALIRSLRTRRLVVAVVVNLVVVPVVGLVIAEGLGLDPAARTGLLLCVICAGGPMGLKASQIAGGDMSWAFPLTAVLMLSNVVTVPLWSGVLLEETLMLRPLELVAALVVVVLFPAAVAAVVRRRVGRRADGLVPRFIAVSNVTLVVGVVLGVTAHFGEIGRATSIPLAAALVCLVAGSLGWVAPGQTRERPVTALITINRATSLALLIVARGFTDDPGVFSAAITFGGMQTIVAMAFAMMLSRKLRRAEAAA